MSDIAEGSSFLSVVENLWSVLEGIDVRNIKPSDLKTLKQALSTDSDDEASEVWIHFVNNWRKAGMTKRDFVLGLIGGLLGHLLRENQIMPDQVADWVESNLASGSADHLGVIVLDILESHENNEK